MKWDIIKYDGRMGRARLLGIIGFGMFSWYVLIRTLIPGVEAGEVGAIISMVLFTIPIYWVMICSYIKRLHDVDRPGIELFYILVPIVNIFMYYILFLKEGTDGPNKYGLPEGDGTLTTNLIGNKRNDNLIGKG